MHRRRENHIGHYNLKEKPKMEISPSDSADFAVAFLIRTAIGVFITVLYVRNIVLLTRPSAWAYTATGSSAPNNQVVDQNPQAPNTNFNEGGNRLN